MKWFLILFLSLYLTGAVYFLFKISSNVDDILILLEEVHWDSPIIEGQPFLKYTQ